MVIPWYLVLALWVLVTSSTPAVLPLISNAQDYAELAQQSSSLSQRLGVRSSPVSLDRVSPLSASSLNRRAPPPSAMNIVLEPTLPSTISILPLLSYSTILAIIGFISLRIAKWRQRRRERQQAHALGRDGVELLPTSTATISPRFRDLPVPPPLPPNSPHFLPKSASATSLYSLSSPRPTSPAPAFVPYNRRSRELERPKSPVQPWAFSPSAKIKRRSNSLDLGAVPKKRHATVPTPLRRPFFVSEPEPEHDHLLSSDEVIPRYRDNDDVDDDLTLIHFSPTQRTKPHHDHALWHSSPNTPLTQSYGTETALIDFTSSASLDKPRISTPVKRDIPVSTHTVAWALDIEVPRTSPPPTSLPPPLVASSQSPLHHRTESSSSENLIDFSPKSKKKILEDQMVAVQLLAVEAPTFPPESDVQDSPISERGKETEKGYEGGDEDEMDITLDGGRKFRANRSAPLLTQRDNGMEEDVVDVLQKLEGGLLVGQPLSAVPSTSSSEPVADEEAESKSMFDAEVGVFEESIEDGVIVETSQSPSPVVVSLPVGEADDNLPGEVDPETTLVEEAHALDALTILNIETQDIRRDDNVVHELINDHHESDEDLSYLAPHLLRVNEPTHPDMNHDPLEVDEAFIKVSLPPSPVPSECGSLPDLGEAEVHIPAGEEAVRKGEDEGIPHCFELLLSTEMEKEVFPDPELLPLPQIPLPTIIKSPDLEASPSLTLSSSSPISPSPSHSPQQIPTPPASPPHSPRLTGLSNITNRPAWSVRAADMPPLGLHANGAHSLSTKKSIGELGGRRHDENWDVVKRRKIWKVTEETKVQDEDEDENEGKDVEEQLESEPTTVPTVVVEPAPPPPLSESPLSPSISITPLPGAFPTDVADTASDKITPLPASTDTSPPAEPQTQPEGKESQAVSTSLAASNTHRRPVRRSAIDIALAMQLRPGLGVGADPAWMVRFLMAMFGWFVVLISGSTGDAYGYGMSSAFVTARRRD